MDVMLEVKKAIKYSEQKDYKKAQRIYLDILEKDKNNPVILSFLGVLYLNTCKFKQAKKYLKQAEKIKPSNVITDSLGLVEYYLGNYEDAYHYLSQSIKYNQNFDLYDKYIKVLIELNKNQLAYEQACQCHKMYPLRKEALNNLAWCCMHVGKLKEASNYLEQLLKQNPKYGEGWLNFGLINEIYYHNEKLACECYKNALRYGDKNVAYYNLAINAHKNDDYKKAEYYVKKLLKLETNSDAVSFLYSVICFKQRKFRKGFKYYVKKSSKLRKGYNAEKLKNFWDGKTYKNETVLVYCDQGIGDYFMFSRYIPKLLKKFKKIKIFTNETVRELFQRSFKMYPEISVISWRKYMPSYDKSVVLSTLPYLLKEDIDSIPTPDKYLIADEKKVEEYKNKYFNTDKLKVGICWEAGAAGWREQLNRTLNVSMYEPFLNLEGVQYYSFQVKPSLDNYKDYDCLIDLGSTFQTFDDTAAALKNVDVMITVDTSVAHLAGALGVKTFMLLPYCPDWRWFDNDKTTEWYNSINIYKQKNPMSWNDVIDSIKYDLEQCLKDMKNN